jgi:hypothetical protein
MHKDHIPVRSDFIVSVEFNKKKRENWKLSPLS